MGLVATLELLLVPPALVGLVSAMNWFSSVALVAFLELLLVPPALELAWESKGKTYEAKEVNKARDKNVKSTLFHIARDRQRDRRWKQADWVRSWDERGRKGERGRWRKGGGEGGESWERRVEDRRIHGWWKICLQRSIAASEASASKQIQQSCDMFC